MNSLRERCVACATLLVLLVGSLACTEDPPPGPPADPGSLLWKLGIGEEIWSPLTHDRGVLYFGCDDGGVYALDTASQSILWEFSAGGRVRSSVHIVDAKAVFASDDGFMYALELSTGEELWRFDLESRDIARRLPATEPPYDYDYLHSSPVAAGGYVYVGSAAGELLAVDLETGQEAWRFAANDKVRATPVVHGGALYFGSWDGILYALDAETGDPRWRFDTGGIVQGAAAVASGKVIVGSRSAKLFAVNADSGELEWEHVHEDGSWVESSPVVREGVVYIGSSDALKLFALDLETGETAWTLKTNGWSWGTPLVADGVVYIGGVSASPYYFEGVELEAGLYAVEQETGALVWRMTPEPIEGYITGGVFSTPVVADQVVYVAGLDGYVYALQQ
jgi:outer membrane protein assembly factor BamB